MNILLGDMVTHLAWGFHETGLSQAREQTERMLPRMTAQMPIRFTRILLGGERGPRESDFVAGAVTDEEGVRATALYKRMTQQYPEVTEWPAICTIYAGRDLPSALGTVDASDFDLAVMRDTGDRFLDLPGIRPMGGKELRISTHGAIQALKIEPDRPPEAVSVSNTLEALQAAVGGYIEVLDLDCGVCLVCNEEGKLLGLPANRRMGDDIIAGTFLIVGEADGEF